MSRASDALKAWVEDAEAKPDSARVHGPKPQDLAAGFARLSDGEQQRLLTLMHDRDRRARGIVVRAIGSSKSTRALEDSVEVFWRNRADSGLRHIGDRLVELALPEGKGERAAQLVCRILTFTSYPGLAKKLGEIVDEFSDARLVELMAEVMRATPVERHGARTPLECWTFAAIIARSRRDELLDAVAHCADTWLLNDLPTPDHAELLAEILANYSGTPESARVAESIRAKASA